MNKVIEFDKVVLSEKSKKIFSERWKIDSCTNTNTLDYLEFKYFFIEYNTSIIGYTILTKVLNKNTNQKYWILLNIDILNEYRGYNIGNFILTKIHNFFISELNINSYLVALNSYLMYKMIAREYTNGIVDFYCLINTEYHVEEMKAEEKFLEQTFRQNPNIHADMIVSFNKKESEKVKLFYFKQL